MNCCFPGESSVEPYALSGVTKLDGKTCNRRGGDCSRVSVHSAPDVIVEALLRMSARIEDPERKIALLTRDSSNSSKPPSSDGPAGKPKPRRPMKSKKRKSGGRPGHKGSKRDLIPIEEVDRLIPVSAEACDQ